MSSSMLVGGLVPETTSTTNPTDETKLTTDSNPILNDKKSNTNPILKIIVIGIIIIVIIIVCYFLFTFLISGSHVDNNELNTSPDINSNTSPDINSSNKIPEGCTGPSPYTYICVIPNNTNKVPQGCIGEPDNYSCTFSIPSIANNSVTFSNSTSGTNLAKGTTSVTTSSTSKGTTSVTVSSTSKGTISGTNSGTNTITSSSSTLTSGPGVISNTQSRIIM